MELVSRSPISVSTAMVCVVLLFVSVVMIFRYGVDLIFRSTRVAHYLLAVIGSGSYELALATTSSSSLLVL